MNTNNANFYAKLTASQVKKITKQIFPDAEVKNMGDGRLFTIYIESNIKNRYELKKLGFILCRGNAGDQYIDIKGILNNITNMEKQIKFLNSIKNESNVISIVKQIDALCTKIAAEKNISKLQALKLSLNK
jgi:hypothetical protein